MRTVITLSQDEIKEIILKNLGYEDCHAEISWRIGDDNEPYEIQVVIENRN